MMLLLLLLLLILLINRVYDDYYYDHLLPWVRSGTLLRRVCFRGVNPKPQASKYADSTGLKGLGFQGVWFRGYGV